MPDEIRYQCRHIFTDGHRCGSPCLRHEDFCYYHHTSRKPVEHPVDRKRRRGTFDLPNPEDRSAIQHAIGQVLRQIASNDIDPRRAGLLLYGLQIASLNLPKNQPSLKPEGMVEDITIDPSLGVIAPRSEFGSNRIKGSAELLADKLEILFPDDPDDHILNDLQAAATTIEAITSAPSPGCVAKQSPGNCRLHRSRIRPTPTVSFTIRRKFRDKISTTHQRSFSHPGIPVINITRKPFEIKTKPFSSRHSRPAPPAKQRNTA